MQKKETSPHASGWRELSRTAVSWGQSPVSRTCHYPQDPEKVCVHECVIVWMCQCVYTGLHMYVCTHTWQCCVHTCPTLCTRVYVPVCKVRTPSPLPLPHAHTDQTRLTELQVSSLILHTAGCLPNGITAKSMDARARLPGFKSCHLSVRGLYLLISKMGFLAPG